MPDRDDCIQPESPPIDWTDDGIYRAAFLCLFDPERRAVLRAAAAILAAQAVSGDTAGKSVVWASLEAVSEDLRMAERLLLEVAAIPLESAVTPEEAEVCSVARQWARAVGDRASEIQAWVDERPDAEAEETR